MKKLLVALMALVCLTMATGADSLSRDVHRVQKALELSCSKINDSKARLYAELIVSESKKNSFDPLIMVAIFWNETGGTCNETVKARGRYIGLGQIDSFNDPACNKGGLSSPECQEHIARLQDGPRNIQMASSIIAANRAFCRRKTGRQALDHRWLFSYQGFNNHARSGYAGAWCGMKRGKGGWRDVRLPKLTKRVLRQRDRLRRAVNG